MDQLRTAVREICKERSYNVEIIDSGGREFQIDPRNKNLTQEMVDFGVWETAYPPTM
jgi:hypothetical protein